MNNNLQAILFDLEGVLVKGKVFEPYPDALELIAECQRRSLPFRIVTNCTTETPESLLKILNERGFSLALTDLVTPLLLLSSAIEPYVKCYVLGSPALVEFVASLGLEIVEDTSADVVICGGGFTVTNQVLSAACRTLLRKNIPLLSLHMNRLCTDKDGNLQLDVGALVTALEYSSGVSGQNLGKPSKQCFTQACSGWDVAQQEVLMISDDPFSDLDGAKQQGFQTAFITTGKYKEDALAEAEQKPDFLLSSLSEVLELL